LPENPQELTISIDRSPSIAFEHSLTSKVASASQLSPESTWLAVTRGSAYVMENQWRGRMNAYNNIEVLDGGDYEPETEYVANPAMMGHQPNNYFQQADGLVGMNFLVDSEMWKLSDEAFVNSPFTAQNKYADVHRFRWHALKDSVHFGMTIGGSKGVEHEPRYRINPKLFVGLDANREDVPLLQSAPMHEGLMLQMQENGHVCRMMTPIGEVSQYLGRDAMGVLTLTTVLEEDKHIHSDPQVNRYTLLGMHAGAMFTLQSYGMAQQQGDQSVKPSGLDVSFFNDLPEGKTFWQAVKVHMNDAPRNLGQDQATQVARFAATASAYPAIELENQISAKQLSQNYLLIEGGVSMAMTAGSAAQDTIDQRGSIYVEAGISAAFASEVYNGGQAALNAMEANRSYARVYDSRLADTSKKFDMQHDLLEKVRDGRPIITNFSTGESTTDPQKFKPELRWGIYDYKLEKDSQQAFEHYTQSPYIMKDIGKGMQEYTPTALYLAYNTSMKAVDLDFYERLKQQQNKFYMQDRLGGFE